MAMDSKSLGESCGFSGTNLLLTWCSLNQGVRQSCLSLSSNFFMCQHPAMPAPSPTTGTGQHIREDSPRLDWETSRNGEDEKPIPKGNHSGKSMC